jgi:gamma-glutamylcyclotransferase (GGCT)/AIG2-like uncharacterized protein YtfP
VSVSVFAYGTLMCADILAAAGGGHPPAEPATLADFSRHPVAGEDYPGIRRHPGEQVSGLLYRGVDSAALARLDAFEGPQYRRETVTVKLADGSLEPAQAWIFANHLLHLLEAGGWDFDTFLRDRRDRFERRYVGFQHG